MKTCDNCKHHGSGIVEEPCCLCPASYKLGVVGQEDFTMWEPKNIGTACREFFEKHTEPATDDDKKEDKKMSESLIKDDSVAVKRKTKAQLMEELEQKNTEIAALKKELERSENYELFVTAGKEMRDAMDGLVAGGLTEEQAFQVLLAGAQLAAGRRR